MSRSPRVEALQEAAISVVAAHGLRGLTHRAVDTRAGVPAGSTSYYFRTRRALLRGVAEFIAERELADIGAARIMPDFVDEPPVRQAADLLAGVLAHWLGPARDRTRARLEIWLLVGAHPETRAALEQVRERFLEQSRILLEAAGHMAPDQDAHLVAAFVEGLTYDGIAHSAPGPVDRAVLRRAVEMILQVVVGRASETGQTGQAEGQSPR